LSPFIERSCLRLALIAALGAALALAACGRKGTLDPPPGASLAGVQSTVDGKPVMDRNGVPRAPVGPDKHIPLDSLLN
jgi:predicted small lipoprotein YifL